MEHRAVYLALHLEHWIVARAARRLDVTEGALWAAIRRHPEILSRSRCLTTRGRPLAGLRGVRSFGGVPVVAYSLFGDAVSLPDGSAYCDCD